MPIQMASVLQYSQQPEQELSSKQPSKEGSSFNKKIKSAIAHKSQYLFMRIHEGYRNNNHHKIHHYPEIMKYLDWHGMAYAIS
jgi:hypothetical protein